MAGTIFRACKVITTCIKSTNVTNNGLLRNDATSSFLLPQLLLLQSTRNTSFFMKKPASELWKSVTSVSNAGKRRGRGKGAPKMRDLNKGQKLGIGKVPIVFPGLNAPVVQGDFVVQQRRLMPEEQDQSLTPEPEIHTWKRKKLSPLERGWTGGLSGGRKIGPPDPIDGDAFHGFETWILFHKQMSVMTSNMGRAKCARCLVVTGNRNGLAGFAMTAGNEMRSAMNTAKNKAGQRLIYIERYNEHTVIHDFFTQFGRTKIFVKQKPKGYGLRCHRVIRACCEAIGIRDIYAKVEGSMNVPHIVKAFFIGLLQQKTHEQMAQEKKLHLVEIRKENNYFPTVLASPTVTRDSSEILPIEHTDFQQYVLNGRVPLEKKRRLPFYTRLPSWLIHLRKAERRRGQDNVILQLRAEYGEICSFLTEKYPEARPFKLKKRDENVEEESSEV